MDKQNTRNTQTFEQEFFTELRLALQDTFTAIFTVENFNTLRLKFLDGKQIRISVESIP